MANYNNLKTAIQAVIKANGNQEITGDILQNALLSMINSLGEGYQFIGVATPATNPGTPDQKVFYVANGKGTYTNFGGISITEDEIVILYYDTAWHKLLTGIASNLKVTKLNSDYLLFGNWSVNGNSLYIDKLAVYTPNKQLAQVHEIQKSFNIPEYYYLLYNIDDSTLRVSEQQGALSNDVILLVGAKEGFNEIGELYLQINKKATDIKLNDVIKINTFNIPLSIEYNNKAVDNNGEVKDVAGFGIYTPLQIPKGVTLEVTTVGYLLGALCLVKDGKYTPVIAYGNDEIGTPRTSKYTTEEAGLYVISSSISNDVSLVSNSKIESNDTHILPIALIGETEWQFTGKVYEPCDETNNAQLTYMATQNYIEFNNEEDILNSISNISGKTLYIYQYDEMFNFLGNTHFVVDENTLTISSYINKVGCRYIKFLISNSDMSYFSHKNYYVEVKITSKNRPKLVYNGYGENNEILFRTYDIEKPYITDNCSVADGSATTDYRGNNERLLNWGYIVLPENYSIDGEPVPVIIHCHGTSGVIFNQKSLPYNTSYLKFLAKCGYAVIGCSTFSNEYRNANDDGNFPTPLAMSCYENLWKYMTNGYNLDKSKAYIFGYSAGGMDTILVSQSKVLPIRAAASLAGSVDLICNMRILADYCNEFFYKQIGMGVVDLPTGLAEDGVRMHPMKESVTQQILDNWDKFVGYNPFCFNSDLDYKAFLGEYSKLTNNTESLKNNQIINELVSKAKVYYKMPIKFWYAIDDTNVPIQLARWWQTMVRNAGGLCYMREFPANCGAHYAVGYTGDDSLTPKVDYVTPFGETINAPVAYAEMVDWFKRW